MGLLYGGQILININSFNSRWISRDEYFEYGSDIINRKIFC